MFFDLVEDFTTGEIVDLYQLGRTSDGHQRLVRGKVCGKNGVVFLSKGKNAFARFQFPTCNLADFTSPTTSCKYDFPISAED